MAKGKKQLTKEEVQEKVTTRILSALESGMIPWEKPWVCRLHDGASFNPTTDRPYKGALNTILLWLAAAEKGWTDPRWMGRVQAKKAGFSIKGLTNSVGTTIFAPILRKRYDEDGEPYFFCVGFREVMVFNAQQIESGIPALETLEGDDVNPEENYEFAAHIIRGSGASVRHGGDRAFYSPVHDFIQLPNAGDFDSVDAYWSTALHELTHWTGHDSRLKRGTFGKGRTVYAFEELVAEMGSAFLCAYVGVEKPKVMQNHEAYIQHWISHLHNDKTAFLDAATLAWASFQYLTGEKK